ncbi:MAG: hypothetical protein Q8Q09_13135 [Deltaproteobacteria bacterium]|nr:hypothetical protein [Deltaproteobacteria bacterium]
MKLSARTPWCLFASASLLAACGDPPCNPATCPTDVAATDGSLIEIATPTDIVGMDASDAIEGEGGRDSDRVSLEIDPNNSSITVTDGMPESRTFRAIVVTRAGLRFAVDSGLWSLSSDRAGTIGGDGRFTANGVGTGAIEVRCQVPDLRGGTLMATTTVTVRSTRIVLGMGVTMDDVARFDSMPAMRDAAESPRILYPLHQALMPENVQPPNVQWERGAANDLFRVRLSKPNFTLTSVVRHSGMGFDFSYGVDLQAWRALAEADPESPIFITVDRLDSAMNRVLQSGTTEIRFARGSIFGSVYYWDLDAGRMVRINARNAMAENFMPNPPDRANGQRCVACHTVSRDGRWMSAASTSRMSTDGFQARVFDLTADLSPTPAPAVSASVNANCSTFSPDSTRVVACGATWSSGLTALDPRTGMSAMATGLPTANATMPEWSPDGNFIAFVQNVRVNVNNNPIGGDIALLPVVEINPLTVSSPTTLHTGASATPGLPMGQSDAWPTWAPSSQMLVFQHGAAAFSFDGPAALYAIARTGGSPVRLDRANGGAGGTSSYRPTFSPFTIMEPAGRRLNWVAFYSTRDYGNAQAGTAGTRRRQLWVAAIDLNAAPGTDPSFTPYWLPGQNRASNNVAGYWAPEACRMNGNECRTNSECCSGRCNAMGRCEPPPPAECRRRGQTCGADSECCMGLRCFGNVCEMPLG